MQSRFQTPTLVSSPFTSRGVVWDALQLLHNVDVQQLKRQKVLKVKRGKMLALGRSSANLCSNDCRLHYLCSEQVHRGDVVLFLVH